MHAEIKAAADWWANRLREIPDHDCGDGITNALAFLVASKGERPTEEQIEVFRVTLEAGILANCRGCWYPDDPERGSALREVGVDYGPCRVLCEALVAAGIKSAMVLPWKTAMRINPGSVTVARGYRSPETTIYPPATSEPSPSSAPGRPRKPSSGE